MKKLIAALLLIVGMTMTTNAMAQSLGDVVLPSGYTPNESAEALALYIHALDMDEGLKSKLTAKLASFVSKLDKGSVKAALAQLRAFMTFVDVSASKEILIDCTSFAILAVEVPSFFADDSTWWTP